MTDIKPTVGSLVYYYRGKVKDGPLSAIVTGVYPDAHNLVDLSVFEKFGQMFLDKVAQKDNEDKSKSWDWMTVPQAYKIEKDELPHKIWSECINCPKFPDCDEVAMLKEIGV